LLSRLVASDYYADPFQLAWKLIAHSLKSQKNNMPNVWLPVGNEIDFAVKHGRTAVSRGVYVAIWWKGKQFWFLEKGFGAHSTVERFMILLYLWII
jgi:hypothetical protein